jgi:predicted peptidase
MGARSKERPSAQQIELAEAQILEQSRRIDFYLVEYSVELLAQKLRDNEYVVPNYQREFTWGGPP